MSEPSAHPPVSPLRRELGLGLLLLYGLGVTIGAGIYVLIGVVAGRAGLFAPGAFLAAAVIMAFSAGSFAELSARFPVSAGEAAYVRAGLRSDFLAGFVGLVVVAEGVVAAATISLGAAAYLGAFLDLPGPVITGFIVCGMGALALLATRQSVGFAGALTLVELSGLVLILWGGFVAQPENLMRIGRVLPISGDGMVWIGVLGGALLAFFAFIGFEDMVNVAEETRDAPRILPKAIFLTLIAVTVIYFLVSAAVVLSVPPAELAAHPRPLALVFDRVTGLPPQLFAAIAIVATLNGVIIQIIMSSRVIYGLSRQGTLPGFFGRVNAKTGVPVLASVLVTLLALTLALGFSIETLAALTSRVTLLVFIFVNLALVWLKLRKDQPAFTGFQVPLAVPLIGTLINLIAIFLPV